MFLLRLNRMIQQPNSTIDDFTKLAFLYEPQKTNRRPTTNPIQETLTGAWHFSNIFEII
ncbi:18363_t:CDS:2, partial [Acaulospora morrowiae]